jgi:hypothetical protein
MSEDRWRTRLRWVVVHPHDPAAGVQRATLLAVPGRRRPRPRGWPGQAGDAAVAARVVEELERGPGGDGGQPWAAHGWFAEAERWLRSTMERLGRPLTGPVHQARVWRLSCLLRAPTGDGDVWFKANTTSPLFINEGVVMGACTRRSATGPWPPGRRGGGPVRAGLDRWAGGACQDLVPGGARVHPAGGRPCRLADGPGAAATGDRLTRGAP